MILDINDKFSSLPTFIQRNRWLGARVQRRKPQRRSMRRRRGFSQSSCSHLASERGRQQISKVSLDRRPGRFFRLEHPEKLGHSRSAHLTNSFRRLKLFLRRGSPRLSAKRDSSQILVVVQYG
jgi:hypothetical protein